MTPDEVGAALNVPRGTLYRFETFIAVLRHWQKKMNLIATRGGAGFDDVWERHILDCGRVFPLVAGKSQVMDIGSGAGLPGLVLAMMAADVAADMKFLLVESNTRKCAFLRTAAREVGVEATTEIINGRVEEIPAMTPAVITARAVASLEKLLDLTSRHHHSGLECVFFKGARYREELTTLENYPNIASEILPSGTHGVGGFGDGVVIRLSGFNS